MPLPFFNRKAKASTIDVTASSVPEVASLPAICTHAQPDLGDYRTEFPEALPREMRWLPAAFRCFAILGFGLAGYLYFENTNLDIRKRDAERKQAQATNLASSLKAQLQGLFGSQEDIAVLTRWGTYGHPLRNAVIAVANTAMNRVQIRSLEIKRRDPNILRFSVLITCAGTKPGFDEMRANLREKLAEDGWVVNETQPEAEDTRLIFDATITRSKAESKSS